MPRSVMRFIVLIGILAFSARVSAEILSFVDLKSNESIIVFIKSDGIQQPTQTMYQVYGGKKPMVNIVENPTKKVEGLSQEGMRQTLGDERLSADDLFGLDAYLVFLRLGPPVRSEKTDEVLVGYYRDGGKIGEERFEDKSALLSGEIREDGRIVQFAEAPAGVPPALFAEIVAPWMLTHRMHGRIGAVVPLAQK